MKITFACPSCGVKGSSDSAAIGRQARCNQYGCRFDVPGPVGQGPVIYAMEEPARGMTEVIRMGPAPESVYVSSRGSEPTSGATPRRLRQAGSGGTSRAPRSDSSGFATRSWLVRCGAVAVLTRTAVALLAPRGTLIAGLALVVLGSTLVMSGFVAGAYGAFTEDFLYGALYLLVPLCTAYYIITRWETCGPGSPARRRAWRSSCSRARSSDGPGRACSG
jgi:hypothetical protein